MIPIAKPIIGEEELSNVMNVMKSGMLAQATWVKKFESEFAQYLNVAHAAAVTNGTSALDLAMRAIGIGFGDEVSGAAMRNPALAPAHVLASGKHHQLQIWIDLLAFHIAQRRMPICLCVYQQLYL